VPSLDRPLLRGARPAAGRLSAVIVAGLVAIAALAAPAPAVAQDGLDSIEINIGQQRNVGYLEGIDPPALDLPALDVRWYLYRDAEDGSEAEQNAFDSLVATRLELGIRSLPSHALVLLLEADTALQNGDLARAEVLRDRAEGLAPRTAPPRFFDARLAWRTKAWNPVSVTDPLVDAWRRLGASPAGRRAIETWGTDTAGRWLTLLALGVLGLLVLRHAGRAALDLRLALLRGPSLNQARWLIALVVLAPGLIVWSPFAATIAAAVIVAPYLNLRERLVAAVVLVGLAAMPLLATTFARATAAAADESDRIVLAIDSACDARCVEMLDARMDAGEQAARLARAWVYYRHGAADQRRRAAEVLEDWVADPSTASSGETLRGNLLLVDGDVAGALAAYDRAAAAAVTDEQAAAAHFNRYRALAIDGQSEASREAFLTSALLDPKRVELHSSYRGRSQNVVLMTSPIASAGVYVRALERADTSLIERASDELLRPWYGPIPPDDTNRLLGAGLIALVLGAAFGPLKLTSRHCVKCATPTSRRIYEKAWDASLCVFCYQLAHKPRALSHAQRGAREDRVDVRVESWRYLQWILAPFAPGAGAVLAGDALRGFALLSTWLLGVLLLVSDGTRLAVPGSLGADRLFDGRLPIGLGLVGVAVAVSLVDTWLRARRLR